jgi:putative spermidine/putrescine transport system ATP-binding protein
MAAALQVTGVSRVYGRAAALDGVTLALAEGQVTAVLGPAGAGKTTLINVIAGFDRQYRGAVTMGMRAIDDMAPHLRRFGVVQQSDAFFPKWSLRDNIALPLRLRGMKRAAADRLVETALEMTDLGAAGNLRPDQLGAAELQRAALARAVVHEPRVLLLDEPVAAHHGQARAAMLAAIARLHRLLGATTLVVTRDDAVALALADHLVVLRDGRVIEQGRPRDLYERPQTAVTAGMIGQSSCFAGMITEIEDDILQISLDCGPVVEGAVFEGAAIGGRCRVYVRPERVALAPTSAANMGEGAIDATVIDTRFGGETTMVRVLIGAGAELVVSRPAVAVLGGIKPGLPCAVAWQAHHALVFPV